LVAHAVLAAMEDRGLSVQMLAHATGIPPHALRDRLAATSPFTLAELELVADVLGTRPSSLLERSDGSSVQERHDR
jgi:lambda repressor-like predicted transcriptional regulator